MTKNSEIATFQNVSIEHDEPKIEAKSVILPDSLQVLFDRSKTHLSEEQSITSAEFLAKNQNVFSLQGELGCTDLVYHHINTGDAQSKFHLVECHLLIERKLKSRSMKC